MAQTVTETGEPASAASAPARRIGIPVLFSLTAFLGASLIFVVQPLVAKLLLPAYGGAATVWSTSSFFFQVVLLLGYLFVHGTVRLGPRRQPLAQVPLVVLALILLPLALPSSADPTGQEPMMWLVRTLVLMIALPFLVLSTTGPLLQKWYSWTDAPRAEDPYFLYAASNAGSFIGLLSYPFLVEPHMTLADQRLAWSWAFAAFIALVVACAVCMYRRPGHVASPSETLEAAPRLSFKRQAVWVGLAALPSSLMLGATTHMATDVASIPLLWVVPLAIYIATMVWAFGSGRRAVSPYLLQGAWVLALASLFITFFPETLSAKATAVLLFTTLGVVALVAHSLLAGDRPHTQHLTRYFVLISLGGAIGGLFNGMLAPVIFPKPFEFPLVLALVPLLLVPFALKRWAVYGAVALMLASVGVRDLQGSPHVVERTRTFYGSYTVTDSSTVRTFVHGTTLHGIQYQAEDLRREPTTYYSRKGPLGDIFTARDYSTVTAVGLGTGTLAAYGEPGMAMHFIEIDPEVVRIAEDPDYFTYLSDSEAEVTVEVGDGRLAVEALPDGSQDLIILDAFSSDSIPVHLLTREALLSYREKLKPGGVLAVHISNRVFDLVPVVVGDAQALGMRPLYRAGEGGKGDPLATGATWMALTDDEELGDELIRDHKWKDLSPVPPIVWTDNYSSVLDVLY